MASKYIYASHSKTILSLADVASISNTCLKANNLPPANCHMIMS